VRIALDNYGVGHASLGLLSTLPLDLLKIDRSLIRDLRESPVSRALVTSIIGLAAACGLTTVAKGVSDTGQLDILRDLNCDQWQGDLFGPPVREHELERLLGYPAAGRPEIR
jgi:EAL domain-containing protein (putative c-di-GMP-specific phosphodiesterase class I)